MNMLNFHVPDDIFCDAINFKSNQNAARVINGNNIRADRGCDSCLETFE